MSRKAIACSASLMIAAFCASAKAQLNLPATVSTPVDWTWAYEANALPDASSGPIEYPPGTPGSSFIREYNGLTSESAGGGVYQASTVDSNGYATFWSPSSGPILNLNSDRGYTVEWKVNARQIDEAEVGNSIALGVDEGRVGVDRFWILSMMKDSAGQYRARLEGDQSVATVAAPIQQNTFNRFRVTVRNNSATLYVNDALAGRVTSLRNLQTDRVEFGDFTGTADGEYAMDYLRVYDGAALTPSENLYPLQTVYTEGNRRLRLAFSTPITPETQAGYQGNRMWYQLSADGGASYDTLRPLVQTGAQYSPSHPIAPVYAGVNDFITSETAPPLKMSNGRIIVPFQYSPLNDAGTGIEDPYQTTTFTQAGVLLGQWNQAGNDIEWDLGGLVSIDPQLSSRGLIEPDVAELNTPGRLLMVMRGSNQNNTSAASRSWKAVSEDYGQTWSPVSAMAYSDGSPFFSPSGMAHIYKHSSGNVYWFGNILDQNADGNSPRYPLVMAQVDEATLGLIADSVKLIDTYTPGAPYFDTPQVEMSNFKVIEDPGTHNFLVSFYRLDYGKPSSEWAYMTITVAVPEPTAGGLLMLLGGVGLSFRRR